MSIIFLCMESPHSLVRTLLLQYLLLQPEPLFRFALYGYYDPW